MPYVRDSFWRGRQFTSEAQMQHAAIEWCTSVAGRRECRPLGGAAPLAVFQAVEACALKPLPRKRFVLATWSRATVGPDIHVKVGRTLYSVPWRPDLLEPKDLLDRAAVEGHQHGGLFSVAPVTRGRAGGRFRHCDVREPNEAASRKVRDQEGHRGGMQRSAKLTGDRLNGLHRRSGLGAVQHPACRLPGAPASATRGA